MPIRSMNDLLAEKYRVKSRLSDSQARAEISWVKLKASFSMANLGILAGEKILGESFTSLAGSLWWIFHLKDSRLVKGILKRFTKKSNP